MKKIVILISLILFSSGLFALSGDAGILIGAHFDHEDFEVEKKRYLRDEKDFSFGLQNYNFFDEGGHFGCFEKLSFTTRDAVGIDILVGPGFGFDIYDNIRVQTGAGFHMLFSVEQENSDFVEGSADLYKFAIGFGADFQMKFLSERMFSPVIGFDVSWNPYCRSGVMMDGGSYYLAYDKYVLVGLRPFIGCVWNIPSKKNNGSQHDGDATDL